MATTSPVLALPLPTATDTDQVPADLMTLVTAAEKFMVGRFASTAARTAKIPAPVRGMVSWVDADAYHTYYDGAIWRPFSGQRIGVYNMGPTAASVAAVGTPGGFTGAAVVPAVSYPTTIEATWSCMVQFATSTDQADVGLFVNGSVVKRGRVSGPLDSYSGQWAFDVAAGTVTSLQGYLVKASGSDVASTVADNSLSWLQAVARAQ